MHVPRHRVVSVVGYLSVEPGMQSAHQSGIGGFIEELRSARHISVDDCDRAGFRGLKLGEARHLDTVNMRGSREVALLKFGLDMSETIASRSAGSDSLAHILRRLNTPSKSFAVVTAATMKLLGSPTFFISAPMA